MSLYALRGSLYAHRKCVSVRVYLMVPERTRKLFIYACMWDVPLCAHVGYLRVLL